MSFIVANQWIVKEKTKNVDKQVETSFVSTENVNTGSGMPEEDTIKNSENTTQDTSIHQTKESILTTYKGYPVIAKLEIPKINLETYVISEYSNQALGVSVTKFYGGNPNEIGNFCIAGHNYITKNMFHDLKKLSIGDTFTLVDTNNHEGIYKIYGDDLCYLPKGVPLLKGLRVLRSGLLLGTFKKNRFEPSQAFAMALTKKDVKNVIDFSLEEQNVVRYLKGETIEIPQQKEGWHLVCVDGYPLGWGKVQKGRLKNKYAVGWKWE